MKLVTAAGGRTAGRLRIPLVAEGRAALVLRDRHLSVAFEVEPWLCLPAADALSLANVTRALPLPLWVILSPLYAAAVLASFLTAAAMILVAWHEDKEDGSADPE